MDHGDAQDLRRFYELQYGLHRDGIVLCRNSVHDLRKASRRVRNVLRMFQITNCGHGSSVLDVGCGLGYYTKALAGTGADATGIDISETAIEAARGAFPDCQFRRAAWPEDLQPSAQYDLIWAVDLSLLNTFDVRGVHKSFVEEAVRRLKPDGHLVVGWNTDFSGRTLGNWAHWSVGTLRELHVECGLSVPRVADTRSAWLGVVVTLACTILRRSVPVVMVRKPAWVESGISKTGSYR